MDVQLKLRFSFGRGELTEADDRLFTLLRAVDEYGSLRQASEATGLSYRTAWGMLREWSALRGGEYGFRRGGCGGSVRAGVPASGDGDLLRFYLVRAEAKGPNTGQLERDAAG